MVEYCNPKVSSRKHHVHAHPADVETDVLSWPTGWTFLWTRPTPSGTATGRRSETPELIQLAKNMRQANARGEKLALYDALETNDSAVQVLGDETLCEIGRELVDTVRGKLLAENAPNADIRPSLSKLEEAIDRFVIHANHDGSRPDSFGVAIDAPENADTEYSAHKINEDWLDFQSAFSEFLLTDNESPEVIGEYTDSGGTFATVYDENLARVTTLYGFVGPIEFEDGSVEDYFMVVAEEEAIATETDDEYFASTFNQWWFTVEYGPRKDTAWIPAFFTERFDLGGQQFLAYTAEIDYYQADKDYSGYELPYDFATMTLIVHEDEDLQWEILDYYIETYQLVYSGPDDEEGMVQFDKATFQIALGDKIQFWEYRFQPGGPGQ